MKDILTKILVSVLLFLSCASPSNNTLDNSFSGYDIALGQWSFNKELFNRTMSNEQFLSLADTLGFWGVELVTQFFADSVHNAEYFIHLKQYSDSLGIANASLLIDNAGMLGSDNSTDRDSAVALHQKWIDIAVLLGCPTVRVNAHGNGSAKNIMSNCIKSISELAAYADKNDIYLLIENHGGISSNGDWMLELIQELSLDPVGIMLDVDNWCYERENGDLWNGKCINEFDRYQGIKQLLPFTHSISLKAKEFDENGNETTINYSTIGKILKQGKYEGYVALEFEGTSVPAKDGVLKLLSLIQSVSDK